MSSVKIDKHGMSPFAQNREIFTACRFRPFLTSVSILSLYEAEQVVKVTQFQACRMEMFNEAYPTK
ncbi:MAG: hypothetical protein E2O79_11135 [Caldithrix sp.]|nr:MAG: hypothetical protein E2O79_11135 [Caldithrix sp.]